MPCVAGEKDEKCFLLNGLVLSRWGWLLISQRLLCFPVSLLSLLQSATSCQPAPIFFLMWSSLLTAVKAFVSKEGSRGLSCLGTACCLWWVATVSLFYLNLFIILLKLVDWNHLRDLRIPTYKSLARTAVSHRRAVQLNTSCCTVHFNPCFARNT